MTYAAHLHAVCVVTPSQLLHAHSSSWKRSKTPAPRQKTRKYCYKKLRHIARTASKMCSADDRTPSALHTCCCTNTFSVPLSLRPCALHKPGGLSACNPAGGAQDESIGRLHSRIIPDISSEYIKASEARHGGTSVLLMQHWCMRHAACLAHPSPRALVHRSPCFGARQLLHDRLVDRLPQRAGLRAHQVRAALGLGQRGGGKGPRIPAAVHARRGGRECGHAHKVRDRARRVPAAERVMYMLLTPT